MIQHLKGKVTVVKLRKNVCFVNISNANYFPIVSKALRWKKSWLNVLFRSRFILKRLVIVGQTQSPYWSNWRTIFATKSSLLLCKVVFLCPGLFLFTWMDVFRHVFSRRNESTNDDITTIIIFKILRCVYESKLSQYKRLTSKSSSSVRFDVNAKMLFDSLW